MKQVGQAPPDAWQTCDRITDRQVLPDLLVDLYVGNEAGRCEEVMSFLL